jgi:cytochrome c biogenesis protein
MGTGNHAFVRRIWRIAVSIETGVVLLMLLVIFSALGTIVLQRPATRPEEMERSYSPFALRILDATRLTDVYHSWWFLGLVLLVSVCIVAASLDRLPSRWRYFARPYRYPEEAFRRTLQPQRTVELAPEAGVSEETAMAAAEHALAARGYHPERVAQAGHTGLFAERNRLSQLAVYVVHLSLLLIFLGTMVDGLLGWRGMLTLHSGETASAVRLGDGKWRSLGFTLRSDGAGQEHYPDGTLKQVWTNVTLLQDGHEAGQKQIRINGPLVYRHMRIYQSHTGGNGEELEVAHQPGSWIVWSGVVVMGVGLLFVFYLVHVRLWVVPVRCTKTGRLLLWMGGSANRHKDGFEPRFNELARLIEEELKRATVAAQGKGISMSGIR